ncbi:hypothetical protein OIU77_015650 [Salix suchowensis]|uniref:Late embryogenesis abundant protein LEA-2 subgroup domain-containing protein n=1 Tax=Salix suchowensis TaxID=1278906 RepID=A0ABQ8ZHN1_9ROSI|nr:hypothetical protein OIU77_015650 [Salix suchowensis]
MLPLPPPPPSPLQAEPSPQPRKQGFPVSLNQIVISKQARNQQSSSAQTSNSDSKKLSKPPVFQTSSTSPLVLIVFGIATLIIYLVIKPTNPVFDIPNANLNSIYFDSPEYFNGDLTFLANFSNPNQKIYVRFEYVDIELYFSDRLIGTQALQPFTQRSRETRLESVHVISSLVYLPQNLAVELQKQVQSNKVHYNMRGTFKVRANLGLLHYSYWLHVRCEIEMTGPPTGVIVARSCKTKR